MIDVFTIYFMLKFWYFKNVKLKKNMASVFRCSYSVQKPSFSAILPIFTQP
jgi:hypothetical protein